MYCSKCPRVIHDSGGQRSNRNFPQQQTYRRPCHPCASTTPHHYSQKLQDYNRQGTGHGYYNSSCKHGYRPQHHVCPSPLPAATYDRCPKTNSCSRKSYPTSRPGLTISHPSGPPVMSLGQNRPPMMSISSNLQPKMTINSSSQPLMTVNPRVQPKLSIQIPSQPSMSINSRSHPKTTILLHSCPSTSYLPMPNSTSNVGLGNHASMSFNKMGRQGQNMGSAICNKDSSYLSAQLSQPSISCTTLKCARSRPAVSHSTKLKCPSYRKSALVSI